MLKLYGTYLNIQSKKVQWYTLNMTSSHITDLQWHCTLLLLAHSKEWAYAIVQHPSSVCKHFAQIASSARQMAGSRPNLHTTVHSPACITFLHSPSRLRIRQLDLMSKSRNELLRHWRSGLKFELRLLKFKLNLNLVYVLDPSVAANTPCALFPATVHSAT